MQRSAINEPTWTGHSGAAGAPTAAAARPRFGAAANPALRRQLTSAGAAAAVGGASGVDAGRGSSPSAGNNRQHRFGASGAAGVSGPPQHTLACWQQLNSLSSSTLPVTLLIASLAVCRHDRRETPAHANEATLQQAARRCDRRTCWRSCGPATPPRRLRGWLRPKATPTTPRRCCRVIVQL